MKHTENQGNEGCKSDAHFCFPVVRCDLYPFFDKVCDYMASRMVAIPLGESWHDTTENIERISRWSLYSIPEKRATIMVKAKHCLKENPGYAWNICIDVCVSVGRFAGSGLDNFLRRARARRILKDIVNHTGNITAGRGDVAVPRQIRYASSF